MKQLIETLKTMGIEIPEEKQAEVKTTLSKIYKNVSEHNKIVEKLETDRDKWKQQAEAAEETLKGLDGKNLDEIIRERDEWKRKAEDGEKEYASKLAEREKEDLLKEAFAEIKFTSEAAKKSIMNQISQSVTVKNGKLIGFNDLLEEIRETDASAFEDDTKVKLITKPNVRKPTEPKTVEDIKKIKDATERQNAWNEYIQANMSNKGE